MGSTHGEPNKHIVILTRMGYYIIIHYSLSSQKAIALDPNRNKHIKSQSINNTSFLFVEGTFGKTAKHTSKKQK